MYSFKIVRFNPEGDGVTALYMNDKLYTHGDYYHNKIDTWIDGFIDGIKLNNEVVIEYYSLGEESRLCKRVINGDSPPEYFKKIKGLNRID